MIVVFAHEELSLKIGVPEAWQDRCVGDLFRAFAKRAAGRIDVSRGLTLSTLAGEEVPLSAGIAEVFAGRSEVHLRVEAPRVRAAIVCQLRDASKRLESFVRYHVRLGFEKVYLYFDDCGEVDAISRARVLEGAVVTVRDRDLVARWRRLDAWAKLGPAANDDVQVRQMLNALDALGRARQDGMHWLLHIDSDELFYPGPASTSIASHFRALDDSGCSIFTYYNFEAVPERSPVDEVDPFRAVSLFKRPLALVPRDAPLDFWQNRAPNREVFLFYQNGKSAVRCSVDAVPTSVHLWALRPGAATTANFHRTNDPRNEGIRRDASVPCAVLHFACTDPVMLWRKYATLGDFPNDCVAQTLRHQPDTFHCLCRDVYLEHRADPDAGREAMRRLFEVHIMLDDPAEIERQQAARVLERLTLIPF
ncbi:hypothetical protein CTAYLR_001801 [Chrysophaeum taylorii]|uniref:Glycosyltransferase family 92 protein n=1 Tax=Chrysophaeum taylorii TaxID=2483200 RepID=A0AAD7UAE7_9STRA|nr:hypothetical protein CTAYLR_001801 [Chrysophaeum taylorii]